MRVQPSYEDMVAMTPLNPFDRFPDGRPRVAANLKPEPAGSTGAG